VESEHIQVVCTAKAEFTATQVLATVDTQELEWAEAYMDQEWAVELLVWVA
jgi:hypothetical protein